MSLDMHSTAQQRNCVFCSERRGCCDCYLAILEMLAWLFDFIKHCTTNSSFQERVMSLETFFFKKGLKTLYRPLEHSALLAPQECKNAC